MVLNFEIMLVYYKHIMNWAQKRRFLYISIFLLVIIAVAVLSYMVFFVKTPTCFDGIQNQDESGVDCGGICGTTRVCQEDVRPLNIVWTRYSLVQEKNGLYNAMAYITNPNVFASAKDVKYAFTVYDREGVIIYKRDGKLDINASRNQNIAIFEPGFLMGSSIPNKIVFEIKPGIVWYKAPTIETPVKISDVKVLNATTTPKMTAVAMNQSIDNSVKYEAVAVVYDGDDNAIDFSSTIIDPLEARQSTPIVFTWLRPFVKVPVRTEVVLRAIK